MRLAILVASILFCSIPAYSYDAEDEQNARDMIQILDDFKNFDDVYHTEQGDQIIKRLAEKSEAVRKSEQEKAAVEAI